MGISRRTSGGGVSGCEIRLFRRDKTMTEAKLDEIADISDVQLLHQAAAVGIYCLGGDAKDPGYLHARFALNDKLQDFPLAQGETFHGTLHSQCRAPARVVGDHPI